jgi:predicted MFS family arabinose efflux permease
MGNVIDNFEAQGQLRSAFVLSAIVIFVMLTAHAISLMLIKEEEAENNRAASTFVEKIKDVLKDPVICKVLVSGILWSVASQLTVSFLGVYQIKELGFSMSYIAGLSVLYTAVRVPCSFVFGRFADKNSFAAMLRTCYFLAVISFSMIVFTTPATGRFLYPLYTIFNAAAISGINGGEVAIIFDFAPSFKTRDTLAVKQTACGLLGFLVTLGAAPFVDRIQMGGNRFLGMTIYAQQLLALVSMLISVGIVVYLHRVVMKIKTA